MTEPDLQFPAVVCENLRFPAKVCGFMRPPNAGISRSRGESAVFCENLRFGLSLSPYSSVPLSAPREESRRFQITNSKIAGCAAEIAESQQKNRSDFSGSETKIFRSGSAFSKSQRFWDAKLAAVPMLALRVTHNMLTRRDTQIFRKCL